MEVLTLGIKNETKTWLYDDSTDKYYYIGVYYIKLFLDLNYQF